MVDAQILGVPHTGQAQRLPSSSHPAVCKPSCYKHSELNNNANSEDGLTNACNYIPIKNRATQALTWKTVTSNDKRFSNKHLSRYQRQFPDKEAQAYTRHSEGSGWQAGKILDTLTIQNTQYHLRKTLYMAEYENDSQNLIPFIICRVKSEHNGVKQ